MKTDILAIGDLAEDVFINIHEDNKHCTVDMENEKLILDFGGKIPYDSVTVTPAVGNSGNAAVCAGRLGLSSAILSRIGNDKEGQECILELQKNTRTIFSHFIKEELFFFWEFLASLCNLM